MARSGGRDLHPYPSTSVAVLGTGVVVALLALAGRYGWHRDELYFLEAGHHLAWGYVDQPPFVALVARVAHEIAPGNLVLLRALPALATAATAGFVAAAVRELGGTTRAQLIGAGAAGLVIAGGVASAVLGLPVLPPVSARITGAVNESVAETIGWPAMVDQVAAVVADLPAAERSGVVLLGRTYGEAGALDRFGPARGLPPAYSAHNGYADFRRPEDAAATVVAVRYQPSELRPLFATCRMVGRVDNGIDVDTEVQGTPIVVCRGLRTSWTEAWADLRYLS